VVGAVLVYDMGYEAVYDAQQEVAADSVEDEGAAEGKTGRGLAVHLDIEGFLCFCWVVLARLRAEVKYCAFVKLEEGIDTSEILIRA